MKRVREFLGSRAGFAATSNLITLLASVIFYRPFWEEGDDVAMALLAEGAYGYYEPHILYSNTIYGKILCMFQMAVPSLRWHSVFMYLFTFAAMTSFVYAIAKDRKGKVLSVIVLAGMFYETYVAFQFSKVATVMFEIVRGDLPKTVRRRLTAAVMICQFYSVILRYESFILASFVAGIFGICVVIRECKRGEFALRVKSYCRVFLPVFAIFAVCLFTNRYTYSSGGWKEYADYFSYIEQITDYHYNSLIYDLHGKELADLGVSENDALMLVTYQAPDSGFLTRDLMGNIAALDPKGMGYINGDFVKAWIAHIDADFLQMNSGTFAGLVLICGLILALSYKSRDMVFVIFEMILQAGLIFAVLFYYEYSGRWSHRIVYALLLAELVLAVYILKDMADPDIPKGAAACILLALFVCAVSARLANEFGFREYERSTADTKSLISYMQQNRDKLFVGDVFTMNDQGRYDIFRPALKGQYANYLPTDSVYLTHSPVVLATASGFGYEGPFEALMARDPNVILVDSISPEVELTYCNEHGDGGEYRAEELERVGNIRLYRIN